VFDFGLVIMLPWTKIQYFVGSVFAR